MHAIYSVSPRSRSRSSRSVKLRNSETMSESSSVSHVVSEVDSNRVSRIHRRDADGKDFVGATGQGTNIKMIRLLLEPEADTHHQNTSLGKEDKQMETKTSLVNPLVIGIAGVCVVLLVALVIMGVLFRRKLMTEQSQNAAPVKTNPKKVTLAQSGGVAV